MTLSTSCHYSPGALTSSDSDAEDTHYVYPWRLESEAGLRAARGKGMTDEQVIKFVDGCTLVPFCSLPLTVMEFN